MKGTSTRAAAVVTTLLLAIGGSAVPASAASAAAAPACPVVSGGGSRAIPVIAIRDDAPVRIGPAAACRAYDYVPYGTTVYLWCGWFNERTGYWWAFTNWGWIYKGHLTGEVGPPCP